MHTPPWSDYQISSAFTVSRMSLSSPFQWWHQLIPVGIQLKSFRQCLKVSFPEATLNLQIWPQCCYQTREFRFMMKLPNGLVYMFVYNLSDAHSLAMISSVEIVSAIFYWPLEFSTSWSWGKKETFYWSSLKGGFWEEQQVGAVLVLMSLLHFLVDCSYSRWKHVDKVLLEPLLSFPLSICSSFVVRGKKLTNAPVSSTVELVLGKMGAAKSGSVFVVYSWIGCCDYFVHCHDVEHEIGFVMSLADWCLVDCRITPGCTEYSSGENLSVKDLC